MIRATPGSPFTAALWIWFVLGALAFACIPALRGRDPFWGWLPFWCVVAPLLDLGVLHRRQLLARSQAYLARRVRRRRRAGQQARRLHTRRMLRRQLRPLSISP